MNVMPEQPWTPLERVLGRVEPGTWHPLITLWLGLLIIGNIAAPLTYIALGEDVNKVFRDFTFWLRVAITLAAVGNLICLGALFFWKKWGFIGTCSISLVMVGLHLVAGAEFGALLFPFALLFGLFVLYLLLHLGRPSAWSQME
jgi:hypothetical protein